MTEIPSKLSFEQQINQVLFLPSPLQVLKDKSLEQQNIKVFVKRDDLIHPEISGNKWLIEIKYPNAQIALPLESAKFSLFCFVNFLFTST